MATIGRYGIDFYSLAIYGSTVTSVTTTGTTSVTVSCDFAAKSGNTLNALHSSWNTVTLEWTTPAVSDPNYWTDFIVVRNSYGFPVTPFDGTVVYSGKLNDTTQKVIDTNVSSGYYYYSIYIYTYNTFTSSFSWLTAATAIGLSVPDLGNSDALYNGLPEIYKISTPYTATMDWDNQTLKSFLQNFGFQLDVMQYQTYLVERRYNVEDVNGTLIPSLLYQFGLKYEDGIGMQQNRILLRDAIILSSQKGSLKGLIAYLKDFTGYGISSNIIGSASITNAINNASTGVDATTNTYFATNSFSEGEYVTITGISPSAWGAISAPIIKPVTPDRFTIATTTNAGAYVGGGLAKITAPNPATQGVVPGHNLMLDFNDSSFEQSIGNWDSTDLTSVVTRVNIATITSASYTSSTNTAVLNIGQHMYNIGNKITVSNFPVPIFNQATAVALTAVNQVAGTISFTFPTSYASNISSTSGFNTTTNAYATITPYPTPWAEPTAPSIFPNKTSGILTLQNEVGSTSTIDAYCGDTDPITMGIPVTPGLGYTFSVYTARGATARAITAQIKWYDRYGKAISGTPLTSGTPVTNSTVVFTSGFRPYASANAPTNAAYAVPGISIAAVAAGEFHYFDAAQFEQAYIPSSFDEARQMHVTFKANRINELINPHFAVPIAPWKPFNVTYTSIDNLAEPGTTQYTLNTVSVSSNIATVNVVQAHTFVAGTTIYVSGVSGTGSDSSLNGKFTVIAASPNSFSYGVTGVTSLPTTLISANVWVAGNTLKLVSTGTTATVKSWDGTSASQLMPIHYPVTSYTFSVYAQSTLTAENIALSIEWYDATNLLISTSVGTTFTTDFVSNTWIRPYVTATAPSDAAYAVVVIQWPTSTIDDVLYLDSGLFENSGLLLQYFDGSQGPGLIPYDFMWEGNAVNAGRSHFYQNRYNVQNRLANGVLQSQIHAGATAAFYLAQPGT
jgi:hypothetical protein